MSLYHTVADYIEWMSDENTLGWYIPMIGVLGAMAGLGYVTHRLEANRNAPAPDAKETVTEKITEALEGAVDKQLLSRKDVDFYYKKFQKVGLMSVPPHNKPSWWQELWAKTSLTPWRRKATAAPAKQDTNVVTYFNPKFRRRSA